MNPNLAITVCQPHAWALIYAPEQKPFENRRWPTRHRGRLYIHAGKSRGWLDDHPLYDGQPPTAELVFGALIGFVDVLDCLSPERITERDGKLHPCVSGPWCHEYARPVPLPEPVPCAGNLGLWPIPERILVVLDRLLVGATA
jgi:activating signal cointegrator 1